MLYYKPNKEILKELDTLVYGHKEAKKSLISLVNRSKMRHNQKWLRMLGKEFLINPAKCLLIGQSGTGKTHLIEALSSLVDFPLLKLDATKLNPTGASGGIKENDIKKLVVTKAEECLQNKKGYYHSLEGTIDQMVIFIDEIDKLGRSFDSTGNWNDHVQSNFLTFFDNKDDFAGVSFIFAGAFNEITNKNIKTNASIGFTQSKDVIKKIDDIDTKVITSGLLPELVGRMTSIVEMEKFTELDYRRILLERLLPKKQMDLLYFNITKTDLPEESIERMIKMAVGSGQGVRALKRELDKEFLDREFEYEELEALEYKPSKDLFDEF
jgi:ATP-dependent Clp protease ATP-binding subunit ClpX